MENFTLMAPLFSIITITYNAESVIRPTLESVKCQSFTDFEHIIIDGASKDATVAVAEGCGVTDIKIFSDPDNGLYDAMNKGIRLAAGKYLIFLNAGDAFHDKDTLAKIADRAKSDPDIIYGQTQLVNANREFVAMRHLTAPKNLTFDSFKHGMLVCHQAFIAKRDIVEEYDVQYRFSADYEWCLRCLKKMKASAFINEVLIDYLTDGLTDKNHKASLKERYHIMCKYYGAMPTALRHIGFLFRHLFRKLFL